MIYSIHQIENTNLALLTRNCSSCSWNLGIANWSISCVRGWFPRVKFYLVTSTPIDDACSFYDKTNSLERFPSELSLKIAFVIDIFYFAHSSRTTFNTFKLKFKSMINVDSQWNWGFLDQCKKIRSSTSNNSIALWVRDVYHLCSSVHVYTTSVFLCSYCTVTWPVDLPEFEGKRNLLRVLLRSIQNYLFHRSYSIFCGSFSLYSFFVIFLEGIVINIFTLDVTSSFVQVRTRCHHISIQDFAWFSPVLLQICIFSSQCEQKVSTMDQNFNGWFSSAGDNK